MLGAGEEEEPSPPSLPTLALAGAASGWCPRGRPTLGRLQGCHILYVLGVNSTSSKHSRTAPPCLERYRDPSRGVEGDRGRGGSSASTGGTKRRGWLVTRGWGGRVHLAAAESGRAGSEQPGAAWSLRRTGWPRLRPGVG